MVSSQEPNAHKLCVGLARTYKYNYRYCTVRYIRHIIQGGGAYLRTVFSVQKSLGIIWRIYAVHTANFCIYAVFPYSVQNRILNCTAQAQVRIPAGTVIFALWG
jgi:hypothetical protein